jgi:hypothetical protein
MPLCLPQVMALKTLYKISLLIAGASDFFKRGIRKKRLQKFTVHLLRNCEMTKTLQDYINFSEIVKVSNCNDV